MVADKRFEEQGADGGFDVGVVGAERARIRNSALRTIKRVPTIGPHPPNSSRDVWVGGLFPATRAQLFGVNQRLSRS